MTDQFTEQERVEKTEKTYDHVLISVSNPHTADQLIRLGRLITNPSSVLHIMNVTTESSFPKRMSSWRKSTKLVTEMTHLSMSMGRLARPLASTAKSIPDAILRASKDTAADLIIMGWFGRVTPLAVKKSRVVNKILHKAACDTAVLKFRGKLQDINRLVLPVGLNFNSERLAVIKALRETSAKNVMLVQVRTPGMKKKEEEAGNILNRQARELDEPVEVRVIRASSVVEGILSVIKEDDLIVIGPGREWVFNRFLFGLRADKITNRSPCSVLMYKSREMHVQSWLKGLLKAIWLRIKGAGGETRP